MDNLVIKVCIGSACYVKGSHNIISTFQKLIKENNLQNTIELKAAFCLGNCTTTTEVSIIIDETELHRVSSNNAEKFFKEIILKRVEECK